MMAWYRQKKHHVNITPLPKQELMELLTRLLVKVPTAAAEQTAMLKQDTTSCRVNVLCVVSI